MQSPVPGVLAALRAVRQSRAGVPLSDYVAVVQALGALAGALPGVTGMAAADVTGNVHKLRLRAKASEWADPTLEQLCDAELTTPGWRQLLHPKSLDGTACTSLLWLQRAMRFVLRVLRAVVLGEGTVAAALTSAYDATLRHYHGFFLRGVFAMAARAAPSRQSFLGSVSAHSRAGAEALAGLVDEASAFFGEVDGMLIAARVEAPTR